MGQVIVDPRNFNPSIDLVSVRAAYNDKEVAFHLTWDDPTESKGDGKQMFADAISLQFPPQASAGTERPYFLMGDASDAVYLLRWEQGKGVGEASANGPAKVAALTGGRERRQGGLRERPVSPRDEAPAGRQGRRAPGVPAAAFMPVAFQAWDGGAGETGPKMSLTSWYYLRLEEPQSSRSFIIPPVVALLTLAAMILVVRAANRTTVTPR